MGFTSEIYLTKDYVSKEEWLNLIKKISDYNGVFKSWKIFITIEKNKIRYFVKTKCNLPSTINNLSTFLLKPCNEITLPKKNNISVLFPKIGSNIIDIINYCEVKNKGTFDYLEIKILKLFNDKIKYKTNIYINKNKKCYKNYIFFPIINNLLSINFSENNRYFYSKVPKYLDISKILHLLNTDSNNALLAIDTFPYLQGDFYLNESNFDFDKHSIILGSSGCGKSKFISSLIKNIYKNDYLNQKYKIIVIDPHASLENDIGAIAKNIDFNSVFDSIDLFSNNESDIIVSTELLIDLFKSLLSDQYNSKLERVLRHSIYLLLTNKSFNFKNLKELLLNIEYRNNIIESLPNLPSSIIDFFLSDFNDLKTKSYGESISPIISFIDEMEMLPVFNESQILDNLKDIINNNFLTLFSLDRTKLGDKVTKTISGLVMQQLLNIVESKKIDKHIIFIVDEVSVIENPILSKYLSQARKYNLSLILAGQYFNQISDELKNSIFANVINYFIFRVSKLDANILVDNFEMKVPLDDTKDRKIKLLTELNNRECIVRINSSDILFPAFKARTIDYVSLPRIKNEFHDSKKNNNENKNSTGFKTNFNLSSNISLKEILISNSTSRKVVK